MLLTESDFVVEAVALDHGITSLAFALRERVRVNVWRTVLDELGYPVGPWLNAAKRAMRWDTGRPPGRGPRARHGRPRLAARARFPD